MKLLCTDSKFCAKTKFTTICESCWSVYINTACINFCLEKSCVGTAFSNNAFAVFCVMCIDVWNCFFNWIYSFNTTFVNYFTLILTAAVIVVAVIITQNKSILSENILWQIMLASALTAIPSSVIPFLELKTSKSIGICWSVHFMIVYTITAILLKIFGWFELTAVNMLLMFLAIAFIFLFAECFWIFILFYVILKIEKNREKINNN